MRPASGRMAFFLEDGMQGEGQQVLGGDAIAGTIGILREGEQPVAEHQRARQHFRNFGGVKLLHRNGPWVRFFRNGMEFNSKVGPAFLAQTDLITTPIAKVLMGTREREYT